MSSSSNSGNERSGVIDELSVATIQKLTAPS